MGGEDLNACRMAGVVLEVVQEPPGGRYAHTDLGNAERWHAAHGRDARWCEERERWLVWDCTRWTWDAVGQVRRWAQECVRRIRDEAAAIEAEAAQHPDPEERIRLLDVAEATRKWGRASESSARISAIEREARVLPGVAVRLVELDSHPWLLCCPNGTLDLRAGVLRAPDRADLLTQQTGVVYDPRAKSPVFDRFLADIQPDADARRYLLRKLGHSLTGDASVHEVVVCTGSGANGKGTLMRCVCVAMGDYAQQMAPGMLEKQPFPTHPTDVAGLRGVRLAIGQEATEEDARFDEGKLKRLSGGDMLRARFMGGDFFDFTPTHKLWLFVNALPKISGTDNGIWRRVVVVPFPRQLSASEYDLQLDGKLAAEAPGILVRLLEGLREYLSIGWSRPESIRGAVDAYRLREDAYQAWLNDRCECGEYYSASVAELYQSFAAWWREEGRRGHPPSKGRLSEELGRRGHHELWVRRQRGRSGLRLIRHDEDTGQPSLTGEA